VLLEVVGLAGLGVGVEEEVEAVALLLFVSIVCDDQLGVQYLCSDSHGS